MRRTAALFICVLVTLPGVALAQYRWTPQTGRWINMGRLPKESPELQLEHARSFLVRGDYTEALDQSERFIKFYEGTDFADENQFLRGEIFMAKGEYMTAARTLQQIVSAYPETELYDNVIQKQYEVGDLLYDKGTGQKKKWRFFKKKPLKQAIEVYTMVIDNDPFTDQAAEAQFKVGLSHFSLEEYVEAAFEYRRVVEEYGNSPWVDDASHGLAMCYYKSSSSSKYDQGPSYLTVTAIDRFERRYPGDDRMSELQEIRSEMRETIAQQRLLTAQYHERRRAFRSARLYFEVIADQFSDTAAFETAQAWLSENPEREKEVVTHDIESLRRRPTGPQGKSRR